MQPTDSGLSLELPDVRDIRFRDNESPYLQVKDLHPLIVIASPSTSVRVATHTELHAEFHQSCVTNNDKGYCLIHLKYFLLYIPMV